MKNRKLKSKETKANELIQDLLTKYVKFKNKHFVEEKGRLVLDFEAKNYANLLKKQWMDFCAKKDKNGKLIVYLFNPKALHNEIEKHVNTHRQLAYVNQVMRLLKVKYESGTQEYDQILVAFENGTTCEEAARDFAIQIFEEELV